MKMLLYKIAFIQLFFVAAVADLKAQLVQNQIPPSPSTRQFQKYIDYPVGPFTGVPAISVPLYTIQEGDLVVPISINYHASGTKLTDPNGFLGMGWSLSGIGKVSRTINGKPDNNKAIANNFPNTNQLLGMAPDDFHYLLNNWNRYHSDSLDTEPDIFSYNFDGKNGKFLLKRDFPRTPLMLPFKPIKFNLNFDAGIIDAVDADGKKFRFTQTEYASNVSAYTAWDIQSMTSATDPSNVINFHVSPANFESIKSVAEIGVIDDRVVPSPIFRACWGGMRPDHDILD